MTKKIIKINNMPEKVCGKEYKGFRLSMTNDLVDPTGNVVKRSKHRDCYAKIFASADYQSLKEKNNGVTNYEITEGFSAAAKQMEMQGKSRISCAFGRAKDVLKQLLQKSKTQMGLGETVLAGAVAGMVMVLLSSYTLGVLPALLSVFAIFFAGTGVGVTLIQVGRYQRWLREQYVYMDGVTQRAIKC